MGQLMQALVRLGAAALPPTIHPMVVHFPIALLYLAAGAQGMALVTRSAQHDRFWDRAALWLLTLAGAAIAVAAAAGVISAESVHLTPDTRALLDAHQRDAVLTGLLALASWVLQVSARFPAAGRSWPDTWSLLGTGRGRVTGAACIAGVAAAVMVSITGTLGGSMVYRHCLGIPTRTCQTAAPPTRAAPP